MNDSKRNIAPWDEGCYQTGTLAQPRQRGGLVMLLLVAVVLLGGIITILGFLNIRLFVALKQQEKSALQLENAQSTGTKASTPGTKFSMELIPQPETVLSDLPTPQEIYAGCIDAVVRVRCGDMEGTGIIIDTAGYIVTNCYALDESVGIQVQSSKLRQYDACLVGADAMSDLAVLKIEASGLTAAVFGDSEELQVGDTICTMGDSQSVPTHGTIHDIQDGSLPSIGIDVLSRPGGPLLDRYGQVVGIFTRRGNIIPSAVVKSVVEQLVCQGYVSGRPTLGIQCEPMSDWHQHHYDLPAGLYVTGIVTREAGAVLKNGDILLMVDGWQVTSGEELSNLLCAYEIGDQAILTVLRDGTRLTLTITIEESSG